MRLLRYTHERVRRQARGATCALLERVQQGMARFDADEAGPIATGEAGVRWFADHCRAHLSATATKPGKLASRGGSRRKISPTVAAAN